MSPIGRQPGCTCFAARIITRLLFVASPKSFHSRTSLFFPNDPEWAAGNLHLGHPMTIVTGMDARRDYEDLHLMSLCRHHIVCQQLLQLVGALGSTRIRARS